MLHRAPADLAPPPDGIRYGLPSGPQPDGLQPSALLPPAPGGREEPGQQLQLFSQVGSPRVTAKNEVLGRTKMAGSGASRRSPQTGKHCVFVCARAPIYVYVEGLCRVLVCRQTCMCVHMYL